MPVRRVKVGAYIALAGSSPPPAGSSSPRPRPPATPPRATSSSSRRSPRSCSAGSASSAGAAARSGSIAGRVHPDAADQRPLLRGHRPALPVVLPGPLPRRRGPARDADPPARGDARMSVRGRRRGASRAGGSSLAGLTPDRRRIALRVRRGDPRLRRRRPPAPRVRQRREREVDPRDRVVRRLRRRGPDVRHPGRRHRPLGAVGAERRRDPARHLVARPRRPRRARRCCSRSALGLATGLVNGIGIAYLAVPAVVMTLGDERDHGGPHARRSPRASPASRARRTRRRRSRTSSNANVLGVPADLLLWLGVALADHLPAQRDDLRPAHLRDRQQPDTAAFLAGINVRRRHRRALHAQRPLRRARRHRPRRATAVRRPSAWATRTSSSRSPRP